MLFTLVYQAIIIVGAVLLFLGFLHFLMWEPDFGGKRAKASMARIQADKDRLAELIAKREALEKAVWEKSRKA